MLRRRGRMRFGWVRSRQLSVGPPSALRTVRGQKRRVATLTLGIVRTDGTTKTRASAVAPVGKDVNSRDFGDRRGQGKARIRKVYGGVAVGGKAEQAVMGFGGLRRGVHRLAGSCVFVRFGAFSAGVLA
jgi:hypothetical protein